MKLKLFAVLLLAVLLSAAAPMGFTVDVTAGEAFRYSYSGGIGEVSYFTAGAYWYASCFREIDATLYVLAPGDIADETGECPRIERPDAGGTLHVSSDSKNLLRRVFVPFVGN